MKAIIFDFDGTILDTEHTELTAWQFIYSEYNCVLPLEEWQKRLGSVPQCFDPMLHLENSISRSLDCEIVTKRRREKLAELIANLQPLPGIESWISTAQKRGLKLAIVSGSPRYWIMNHLERINLLKFFDLIITAEDVKALKPSPEGYQIALQKLNISPGEALAIEDSPSGASAALAAGVRCIVVPNKVTVKLKFPETFRAVSSLGEIELNTIIEELY